ncbi:MAG: hypothetical protein QXU99_01780 [Candidatus Bathyarchaeia archaeon]
MGLMRGFFKQAKAITKNALPQSLLLAQNPEQAQITAIVAFAISAGVVIVGLLLHFRKHKSW